MKIRQDKTLTRVSQAESDAVDAANALIGLHDTELAKVTASQELYSEARTLLTTATLRFNTDPANIEAVETAESNLKRARAVANQTDTLYRSWIAEHSEQLRGARQALSNLSFERHQYATPLIKQQAAKDYQQAKDALFTQETIQRMTALLAFNENDNGAVINMLETFGIDYAAPEIYTEAGYSEHPDSDAIKSRLDEILSVAQALPQAA